jgi:hypothetical protein
MNGIACEADGPRQEPRAGLLGERGTRELGNGARSGRDRRIGNADVHGARFVKVKQEADRKTSRDG